MHISPNLLVYAQQMAPYAAFCALVLSLAAILFLLLLSRRIEQLSSGSTGSLEATLTKLTREVKELQQSRRELELYLKAAEVRMHSSLRGVGVVRFNAFTGNGAGGNQSFAIALLDERQSGVVFSALYTRDHVGVYAKPIESGKSAFTLSDEEQEAVQIAQAQLAQKRVREK